MRFLQVCHSLVFSLSSLPSKNSPQTERLLLRTTDYACLRGKREGIRFTGMIERGRDWFRGDSLINARLLLDGGERRGRMLCIIQEKPGGEWRRIDGAKQHMQTMPCAFENSDFIGGFIHHSLHGFQ